MYTVRFYFAVGKNRHKLQAVLRQIAGKYGGYTFFEPKGGWLDGKGFLVEEKSAVLEVITDTQPELLQITGALLKRSFAQDMVIITRTPCEVDRV